jgi:hypothetical protein
MTMADGPDDLPLEWPTTEQRARVEARVRALRARRLARVSGAAAVVIALVVGTIVVLRNGSSPTVHTAGSLSTTSTVTEPRPAIVAAPEPKGWRIVDYGDARLAFPPGWAVAPPQGTSPAPCATAPAAVVVFYRSGPNCPTVTIGMLRTSDHPPRPIRVVHGTPVYAGEGSLLFVQYLVPSLGVEIDFHRASPDAILGTITSSARRVVLGGGALPSVPGDWKTVSFGGISVDVPPTMPVTHLDASHLAPGDCSAVPFARAGAFLGTGVAQPHSCPMIPGGVVPVPTDGVWMHGVLPYGGAQRPVARRIDNGHVHLALTDVALYGPDALTSALDVRIAGSSTIVRVGLGPDPQIARTILASLRLSS